MKKIYNLFLNLLIFIKDLILAIQKIDIIFTVFLKIVKKSFLFS